MLPAPTGLCFEAEVSGGVNAQPGAAPVSPCTSSPFIRRTRCGGRGVVKQLCVPLLRQQPRSWTRIYPDLVCFWWTDNHQSVRLHFTFLRSVSTVIGKEPCGAAVSTNMHRGLVIADVCVSCCRKHAASLKQVTLICSNDCLVKVLSGSVIDAL